MIIRTTGADSTVDSNMSSALEGRFLFEAVFDALHRTKRTTDAGAFMEINRRWHNWASASDANRQTAEDAGYNLDARCLNVSPEDLGSLLLAMGYDTDEPSLRTRH